MLTNDQVKRLEEFYLEAAAATYAGNGIKITIPGLPGSKAYTYERGELRYLDVYQTNGEFSGGAITLYTKEYGDKPVWRMNFHGWCKYDDPQIISFLKHVLKKTYEQGLFIGGRGPAIDSNYIFVYNNTTSHNSNFTYFSGKELITTSYEPTISLFWHKYNGMLWLPVKNHPATNTDAKFF